MKKYSLVLLTIFILFSASISHAMVEVVCFTGDFVRGTGEPVRDVRTFPGIPRTATVRLWNGGLQDSHKARVSSARVTVNDMEIFGPSSLNKNVRYLEATLNLNQGDNEIGCLLKSKPGGRIWLEVVQDVEVTSAEAGPQGRVIEATLSDNTQVKLEIPEGALTETRNIFIAYDPISEPVPDSSPIIPLINFGPEGIIFDKPVHLTFQIPDHNIQNAGFTDLEEGKEFLGFLFFNEAEQRWESLPIVNIDYSQNIITVELTHLSTYYLGFSALYIRSLELLTPVRKNDLFDFQVEVHFRVPLEIDLIARLFNKDGNNIDEEIKHIDKPDSPGSIKVRFNSLRAPNQEQFSELKINRYYPLLQWLGSELWVQQMVVDYDTVVSDDKYVSLLKQYKPILEFAPNEEYYPTFINNIFGHGRIVNYGIEIKSNPDAFNFARMSRDDYFFEFDGTDAALSQTPQTVYATAVEIGSRSYLFYIFYYHYDNKTENPVAQFFRHHGDRERIIVELDENLNPKGIVYGHHKGDEPLYEPFELITEKITGEQQSWRHGGIYLEWTNVKKAGDHPYVYIAEGSHACYPRRGWYSVYTIDEYAGGGIKWRECDYHLLFLPRLSEIDDNGAPIIYEQIDDIYDIYGSISADYNFLLFSGKWGAGSEGLVGRSFKGKLISHNPWWLNFTDWIADTKQNVTFDPEDGDLIDRFDTNCDGCIDTEELNVALEAWKAGEITIWEVMEIMAIWQTCNYGLFDNGDGTITQIRNDGSILMWLQDANYAKTSGYDADGRMTWDEALAWIASLHSSKHLGYENWRLPHALPVNGTSYDLNWSCDGSTDSAYNITSPNSEMSYMYYVELGNLGYVAPDPPYCTYPQPGWGLSNTSYFINLMNTGWTPGDPRKDAAAYWAGTTDPRDQSWAFDFRFKYGDQMIHNKSYDNYVWAVRDAE